MALEPGGYADKLGNRYEGRWVVKQLLRLLNEQLRSVTIEAVGDDEAGVDLWVNDKTGKRLAQQCKLRNGSRNQWTLADLNRVGVLSYMKYQLDRELDMEFHLVTAIPSTLLHDICNSARKSSGDSESFYQDQMAGISQDRKKAFASFCRYLSLDSNELADRAYAYGYLSRIFIENWHDTLSSQNDLRSEAQWLVNGDPDSVLANLADYAENNLRKAIAAEELWRFLAERGFSPRALTNDCRVLPAIRLLREQFEDSISNLLIAGEAIGREETTQTLNALEENGIVILHGRPGHGKSGVLYEITQHFKSRDHAYLALRLDRQEPRHTVLQFGHDIGLPESPVRCLEAISNGRACTLILDQLDAIRWTSGHSKNALEVCKSLVKEVVRLRGLGQPISIILACRTYDLENDPDINAWLNSLDRPEKRFAKIEVGPLSDEVVTSIIKKEGFPPVSIGQLSILKSPQRMAMWLQLVSGGHEIEFLNRVQLMRKYWDIKMQELSGTGVSSDAVALEVSRIIQYMEDKGRISVPYSYHNNTQVIKGLCASGLMQVASNQITFSHQSYLDFQIAINLVREIHSDSKDICGWLGEKSSQSLFRREQLRQVLGLLSEEDPAEFFIEIERILGSKNIRFNLKHLTLEVIGQIEFPDNALLQKMLSLSDTECWEEHVFRTVFLGHSAYVGWLVEFGVIKSWLAIEEKKGRALWLLGSVSGKISDQVSELLLPYIDESAWQVPILECLNWDVDADSEAMFQMRIHLAKVGVSRDFVAWKKVSSERAIRLIEGVLLSHEPGDFTYDNCCYDSNNRSRLENWSGEDLKVLSVAARERPEDVWNRILPQLIRLAPKENGGLDTDDLWLDFDNKRLRSGREWLPNGVVTLCVEAGKELVKNNGVAFWSATEIVRQEESKVVKYLLVALYSQLGFAFADDVLGWLISYVPSFSVGSGSLESKWMPVARLIEAMSPDCSVEVFEKLEQKIIYFKEDKLLANAKRWVSTWREGYFGEYWGHAQYFLLPHLCKKRRGRSTDELIEVLGRKFGGYDEDYFLTGRQSRTRIVSSVIPRNRVKKVSDHAWLNIIGNKNIPEEGGFNWRKREDGLAKESSVAFFARDLEYVARRSPSRFARLALTFSDSTHFKYKSAILDALQETAPKDLSDDEVVGWAPADHELVLAVLEKFKCEDEGDFPSRFCRFMSRRAEEKWPEQVVSKLVGYATSHPHPEPKALAIGNFGGGFDSDSSTVQDLEGNAINCVRGKAAGAIAQLLGCHEALLGQVKAAVECLVEDEHPAVRIASLEILLPLMNLDRDYAVSLFVRAVSGDLRVAASRSATLLFNVCMKSHFDQLYPVVVNMLNSSQEEIVECGAQEVAARWLFHDFFLVEVESCIVGNESQRKGVARVAVGSIGDASYFEKCKKLINRLREDDSKDVRQKLASVFVKPELLSSPEGIEFLIDFIDCPAFDGDPTLLLGRLENYSGDLLPFASLLLAIGDRFTQSNLASESKGIDITPDMHGYMPLMIRLYEQAKDIRDFDIELRCLDIWDGMFEKRVESVYEPSRVIDALYK